MKLFHIISVTLLIIFIDNVSGRSCKHENFFGITVIKTCPGLLDSEDAIFCCGPKDEKRCCTNIFGLDQEDLIEIEKNIPKVIGFIISVTLGFIVCCLVCCCCCPCCLYHQRRNRGNVIRQPVNMTTQTAPAPTQTSYIPIQSAPYPTQPAPYSTQPAAQPLPYPTQAATPYPTQPPVPGFGPPPLNPGGIPMQPFAGDQPPPYTEKQHAYNPNF